MVVNEAISEATAQQAGLQPFEAYVKAGQTVHERLSQGYWLDAPGLVGLIAYADDGSIRIEEGDGWDGESGVPFDGAIRHIGRDLLEQAGREPDVPLAAGEISLLGLAVRYARDTESAENTMNEAIDVRQEIAVRERASIEDEGRRNTHNDAAVRAEADRRTAWGSLKTAYDEQLGLLGEGGES